MYAIVTRAHPLRYGDDSNDHIKDEPPTEDESEFPGPTSLTYMTEYLTVCDLRSVEEGYVKPGHNEGQ